MWFGSKKVRGRSPSLLVLQAEVNHSCDVVPVHVAYDYPREDAVECTADYLDGRLKVFPDNVFASLRRYGFFCFHNFLLHVVAVV
jgi:hypothetical protein